MVDDPKTTTSVPTAWLSQVVNLLSKMAGEGITMGDCADPIDLVFELAEHMGYGDPDDCRAAVTDALNGEDLAG